MKALARKRYVPRYLFASIYNKLGRKEETFEWLEKAYADHSFRMVYLKVNPWWDRLRSDPRFTDLLHRLHLGS